MYILLQISLFNIFSVGFAFPKPWKSTLYCFEIRHVLDFATNIYFDFIIFFYIYFSLLDVYPRGGGITVSFTIFFIVPVKVFR